MHIHFMILALVIQRFIICLTLMTSKDYSIDYSFLIVTILKLFENLRKVPFVKFYPSLEQDKFFLQNKNNFQLTSKRRNDTKFIKYFSN